MIQIREERPEDVAPIRDVNKRAFGQDQEGKIVDALRSNGAALAPMAVLPEHQREGIGSRLVEASVTKLKEAGYPFIIVLGHANYYPRFGFIPASTVGIKCEWDVPAEVFMVLVLDQGKMQDVSGLAKYRPEFSATDERG